MKYTVTEIIEALQPEAEKLGLHVTPGSSRNVVAHLLIDSRSLTEPDTTMFFALRTHSGDGHLYIPALYAKGVRAFVVDNNFADAHLYPEATFLHADSPAATLAAIAAAHRARFNGLMIGITGSKGKTMVKEWLYRLFKPEVAVERSPRSYNSSLGVPLSLWQTAPDASVALIEAGISRPGEMALLESIIRPDIVVLTDISEPHDEGFTSRQEKIAEKLLLARNAATLVYPADDPEIEQAVREARAEGRLRRDIRLVNASDAHPNVDNPNLTKPWQVRNLHTCLATIAASGIDVPSAAATAATIRPMRTRLNVTDGVNNCIIVADDYTCDLHSLAPAIDFLALHATERHSLTLILADLDHTGNDAAEAYAALDRLCKARHITRLIGIGKEISAFRDVLPEGTRCYTDMESALIALSPSDFSNEAILIKGNPDSGMDRLVHLLEARTHETVLEVNLDAMVSNFNFYRSKLKPTTGMVAMVKASGYGAGSYELAKTLQSRGAAYLAVAVLDEGIDLRNAGITMPIMVLNPKVLNYPLLFQNRLEPEIFGFDILEEIIAEARKLGITRYPIHIKLDTGMHRLGFLESDLPRLIELLRSQNEVEVSSVFSHLATADCFDKDDYTLHQLNLFERCSHAITDAFPHKIKRHILNTAGMIRFPEYQYDMVRLGIGLYGVPVLNDGSEAQLRPVSTLRSPIIALKTWEAGTTIGYGQRGVLKRRSIIATVPIGYADGIDRHMGCGNVSFLVNGVKCPTVGNICMDILMLDVTDADAHVGDSVVIFGEDNPASLLSDALGTIPYEILTSVSPRVRRTYYSE